jgi:hypothetical protein
MTDLTEHRLADGPDLSDETAAEAWRIDGDREMIWAGRKLAHHQAEIDRIRAILQAELDTLTRWATDAMRPHESSVDFFTSKIINYRLRLEDADPNLPKTYKVPGCEVTRRQQPTAVTVTDPEAFIEWAVWHDPDALSPVRPTVARLKAKGAPYSLPDVAPGETAPVVSADGEVVPGVAVTRAEDKYAVKIADTVIPETDRSPF